MSDAEAAPAPASPPKSPQKTAEAPAPAEEPQDEGSKLYIGNLAFKTDEDGLRDAFSKFGNITFARVIYDRMTDRSRSVLRGDNTTHNCAAPALGASRYTGAHLRRALCFLHTEASGSSPSPLWRRPRLPSML